MSRVLTFSTAFPGYHSKAGEPTYFVEKILLGLPSSIVIGLTSIPSKYYQTFLQLLADRKLFEPKGHTIRAGKHWKVGDKFSPRIWSGKPYNSKQLIIAPDIEVKKVWDFEINRKGIRINGNNVDDIDLELLARNDGLSLPDFLAWFKFPKDFSGQIIYWDDRIEY